MGRHLVEHYTTPPLSTALKRGAAEAEVRIAPDCMMAVLHEDSFQVFPVREDYRCAFHRALPRTRYTKTPIRSSSKKDRAPCGRTTPDTS